MTMPRSASTLLLAVIDPPGSGGNTDARSWIALLLLLLGIAMLVRCVARGRAAHDLRSLWAGMALLMAAPAVWLWPVAPSSSRLSARDQTATQDIALLSPDALAARQVIARRCSACHSSQTTLMRSAPWGLNFDEPDAIDRLAPAIYRQVVVLQSMPMANSTHMTSAERAIIARWYQQQTHSPAAPKPANR